MEGLEAPMVGFRLSGSYQPRGKRAGPVAWQAGIGVNGLELFLLGGVALMAYTLGVFKPKVPTPGQYLHPPELGPSQGPFPQGNVKPGLDETRMALIAAENSYKFAGGGSAALDQWRKAYRAMQTTYPEQAVFYDKPPGYDDWLARELAPPEAPTQSLGPGYGGGGTVSVQTVSFGGGGTSGGAYTAPSGGGAAPGQPLHFL